MEETTKKETSPKHVWAILVAVALVAGLVFIFQKNQKEKPISPARTRTAGIDQQKVAEIKKFGSEQEFKDYIAKAKSASGFFGGRGGAGGPGLLEMSAKSNDGFGL